MSTMAWHVRPRCLVDPSDARPREVVCVEGGRYYLDDPSGPGGVRDPLACEVSLSAPAARRALAAIVHESTRRGQQWWLGRSVHEAHLAALAAIGGQMELLT